MAFAVLIGSIPETQVQAGERERLEVSKVVRCSHILVSWVTVVPLNRVLQEAIDGGQLLRADLWHPWRLPVFHTKTAVRQLHQELIDALDRAVQEKGSPPASDWYGVDRQGCRNLCPRRHSQRSHTVFFGTTSGRRTSQKSFHLDL